MPSVIQNYQKKVAAERLKQTYSILGQVFEKAKSDYGDAENWDTNIYGLSPNDNDYKDLVTNYAEKYMVPYLKLSKKPQYATLEDYGYDAFYTKAKQIYWRKNRDAYIIPLNNGVLLFLSLDGNSSMYSKQLIFVDINGKNPPNMAGRDIYLFAFQNGRLRLYGDTIDISALKEYCRPIVQHDIYVNFYCTALVAKNGWVIDKNYPW